MKKIFSLVVAMMLCITTLSGCGTSKNDSVKDADATKTEATEAPKADEKETKETGVENPLENTIKIEIEMEDGAIMKADLYPDIAPNTVANFVNLCKEDFFAGLIFHRVIPNFMIQGGGFDVNLTQKEADSIDGEFKSNGFNNRLKHTRGVLSMARTNDPNSASSQFFIMHAAAPHLDGEYAAFGIITEGIEEVDKIAGVKTGNQTSADGVPFSDVPQEPQVIKTIRVIE